MLECLYVYVKFVQILVIWKIWQYVIISSPQYLTIIFIISLNKLVIVILFDQISNFINIMAAFLDLCKLGKLGFFFGFLVCHNIYIFEIQLL